MEVTNASRPDQRCTPPSQDAFLKSGILPYITRAVNNCTTARVNASVASQTLTVCGLENPATFTATPVGSCSLPYTPSAPATKQATSTGMIRAAAVFGLVGATTGARAGAPYGAGGA